MRCQKAGLFLGVHVLNKADKTSCESQSVITWSYSQCQHKVNDDRGSVGPEGSSRCVGARAVRRAGCRESEVGVESGGSTALEAAVRALPGGFSTRPLPTAEGCSLVVRGDPPGTVGEVLFI